MSTQPPEEFVDISLTAQAVVSHGVALQPDADLQNPAWLVQRENVFVRLVVSDVDGGVAAVAIALAFERQTLVGRVRREDVDDLLTADHSHGPQRGNCVENRGPSALLFA